MSRDAVQSEKSTVSSAPGNWQRPLGNRSMYLELKAGLVRRYRIAVVLISVFALAIRLFYVLTSMVDHPFRGDAGQYFTYALNLVHRHVFSFQAMNVPATADSFRDAGYPSFLVHRGLPGKAARIFRKKYS